MGIDFSAQAKGVWGNLKSKVDDAKKLSIDDVKGFASEKLDSAKEFSIDKMNHAKELMSKENVIKFSQAIKDAAADATSPEKRKHYFTLLNKATEDTWKYMKDSPEVAIEKYKNMDKGYKILAISAMAGGAIVSIPFIMAAGSMSIVSALAVLGLGALSAGGYGVAGGIVVTAGGAALAAALAATVANKVIDDPEVNELIEEYGRFEEIIKQNFATMENNQEKYKQLYEKYAKAANYVAQLQQQINNGEEYDINEVRDANNRIKIAIEDLEESLEGDTV